MSSPKLRFSFPVLLFVLAFFFMQIASTFAYTLGSSHWVERPSVTGSILFGGDCYPDINGNPVCYDPTCAKWTMDAYMVFGQVTYDGVFYSDSSCSNPSGIPWKTWSRIKEAVCPTGEVMVGTRFYQWFKEIDSEHEDAQCTKISGTTLGASRWVTPANAYDKLNPGYKVAVCNPSEVMTGIRMYGIAVEVDEEHMIARCTQITGVATGGTYYWQEAPNAYSTLYGGYKEASCNTGDLMRGVRWAESAIEVDQEHTDAYCYTEPTVNLNFSLFIRRILSFI